ncbi:hypothetical protein [Streptomyces sp. NPDC093225]|uniref:hypothetical protein n=1 Tax=Streptomyces sp. NPDC093225 TaxID=3366034 RepID=UPI003810489E
METAAERPDFWTDVNTLRTPAYRAPTDDETIALADAVAEAADAFAIRISARAEAYRAEGQEPRDGIALSGDYALTTLYAFRQVQLTVEDLAEKAATLAGHQNASYTLIGEAWGITRQSARLKWPKAVPPRGVRGQDPITLHYAGGAATMHHHPDTDTWSYTAIAADGTERISERDQASPTDATAAATAFLIGHAVPAT